MLVANGQESLGVLDLIRAAYILIGDSDASVALDFVRHSRHGDTAFRMTEPIARGPDYLRIDVDPDNISGRELEDDKSLRDADMRSRDSDARGGAQGVDEIVGEVAEVIVESSDRLGDQLKARVRKFHDRPGGHAFLRIAQPSCIARRKNFEGVRFVGTVSILVSRKGQTNAMLIFLSERTRGVGNLYNTLSMILRSASSIACGVPT